MFVLHDLNIWIIFVLQAFRSQCYFRHLCHHLCLLYISVLTPACMTNIFNMLLAWCWILETSSRLFYDFINREIWPFLIVDIYHFYMSLINLFNKMKHWNLAISMSKLLNLKGPQTFGKFDDLMSCGSKVIFKNAFCLMY